MDPMLYCCCGLDVHKDIIEACIINGEGSEPTIIHEQFRTSAESLDRLVGWLSEYDCFSVAMESTGVYWSGTPDSNNGDSGTVQIQKQV